MTKTQFKASVQIIRSDNGSEFTFEPVKMFYGEQGIVHQTSCVEKAQQNGRVELKNRNILNVVRALRFQANLPI